MAAAAVQTEAEVFVERPPEVVRGQRLGLVTVAGAVDGGLRSTVDALVAHVAHYEGRIAT